MNVPRTIEAAWLNLRYAYRALRKSPGFTLIAVLSLAVGIGVNSAMFTVVHAVVLKPLPYPEPDRLLALGQRTVDDPTGVRSATLRELVYLGEHNRALASLAGYRHAGEQHLLWKSNHEWIRATVVTDRFLRTLGAHPAIGRDFSAEDAVSGALPGAILTDALWKRSFGGDASVLGQTIALNGQPHVVVGVLPATFWFPEPMDALLQLPRSQLEADHGANTSLIGRLRPGASLMQLQTELTRLAAEFQQIHGPEVSARFQGWNVMSYHSWLVGDVRPNLLLLLGATALLLLIACANLATLLLTRFAARERELSVQLALGSSLGRILLQFFVEHAVLAALGAAAGLLTGYALLTVLQALIPFRLTTSGPVRINGLVVSLSIAVATLTALAFTIVPSIAARRLNVQASLQAGGRVPGAGRVSARSRNVLVVVEVALSTTLLLAAWLLIQSLYRMGQEPLGFDPGNLITLQTPVDGTRQQAPERLTFARAVQTRLEALPGVQAVAAINLLPLTGRHNIPTQREGHVEQGIGGMEIRAVTPRYFDIMKIPIQQGRDFEATDGVSSAPVVIVNETVARAWWGSASPVGDRLLIGRFKGREYSKDPPRQIVGVVANTKTLGVAQAPSPTIFIPMSQELPTASIAWIVRSDASAGLGEDLRAAVASVDPAQRVRQVRTMNAIVEDWTAGARFNAALFGVFAAAALIVAAIGLYGVLSFLVRQRESEIGTRLALGADPAGIMRMFLSQGLRLTLIGLLLGLIGAFAAARTLARMLYGVQPTDPVNFAVVAGLLLLVGLMASCIPAYRATRVDPLTAIRGE